MALDWETAYGKAFQIQVSNDASNWTDLSSTASVTGGAADADEVAVVRFSTGPGFAFEPRRAPPITPV